MKKKKKKEQMDARELKNLSGGIEPNSSQYNAIDAVSGASLDQVSKATDLFIQNLDK